MTVNDGRANGREIVGFSHLCMGGQAIGVSTAGHKCFNYTTIADHCCQVQGGSIPGGPMVRVGTVIEQLLHRVECSTSGGKMQGLLAVDILQIDTGASFQ